MRVTLVSTIPWNQEEPKPGLVPSLFRIPKAPKGGISTVLIEDGYFPFLVPLSDEKAPPIRIPTPGEKIAQSIINDIYSSTIAIDFEAYEDKDGKVVQAVPGYFWIEGKQSPLTVMSQHSEKVEQATRNMIAWFGRLIKMADDDWKRTRQHKAISDESRRAADYLGLEKEWNYNPADPQNNVHCPACQQQVSPLAIVCFQCNYILRKDKYNKEAFATA